MDLEGGRVFPEVCFVEINVVVSFVFIKLSYQDFFGIEYFYIKWICSLKTLNLINFDDSYITCLYS